MTSSNTPSVRTSLRRFYGGGLFFSAEEGRTILRIIFFPCKPLFVLTYALFCDICCYERSGERNNMKIIEDLYYGQISPYKNGISATPEYQKLKAPATQNENLLRATLSDEQKERLDKLTENITGIASISERYMFITGLRLLRNKRRPRELRHRSQQKNGRFNNGGT